MKLEPKTIFPEEDNYPTLLKEIQNPPPQLHVLGKLPEEDQIKVAVVGTRKATPFGKSLAKEISAELAERGIIIVSGLAMGIDTAAHEGALSMGGKTIAVLACGLDNIYPRQNESLAGRIIKSLGAIISEYPIGAPPFPNQFLERNRIVSGLSVATVIIEAPRDSGSLVTARLAAEQGREVFVFPGTSNHPNYRGSHKLIRDGARLVDSLGDILEDLGLEENKISRRESLVKDVKDKNQLLIIDAFRETVQPLNIDKIVQLTKLEPQVVNQSLAFLTILGITREVEGGYIIKMNREQ